MVKAREHYRQDKNRLYVQLNEKPYKYAKLANDVYTQQGEVKKNKEQVYRFLYWITSIYYAKKFLCILWLRKALKSNQYLTVMLWLQGAQVIGRNIDDKAKIDYYSRVFLCGKNNCDRETFYFL